MEKLAIFGGEPVRETPIYYGRQFIDDDDVAAVVETLKSDLITCGPKVEELEQKLCEFTEAKYAVVVSNGTAALHLAAMAAGIGEGDDGNLAVGKLMQIGNTCRRSAQPLHAVAIKEAVIDLGTVDTACHQLRRTLVRLGGHVGKAEAARIGTDGGVQTCTQTVGDGDTSLGCKMLDKIKHDLTGCGSVVLNIVVGIYLAGFVMIDHQINTIAVKRIEVSHLRRGCSVHTDHALHRQVLRDRCRQNALLFIIGKKAQTRGDLIAAHAPCARAEIGQDLFKCKRRADRIGIGIAVKQDQRIGRRGEQIANLLHGKRTKLTHHALRPRLPRPPRE